MADAETIAFGPAGMLRATLTAVGKGARRQSSRVALNLERAGLLWLGALSLAYWGFTLAFASRKLMWNDELYTYYIAALPSMSDVWAALMARGEQLPPFFYVPTRLAFEVFGANHLSVRLPEMLGFWLMSVCLFVVVRRSSSVFPAVCAAAFPLVTTAYFYAFEARPYALMLGTSALALLCWQTATLNRHRTIAIAGLALSLMATVSSHYYGVLVLAPFVAGEGVRSLVMRRIDWPIWGACGMPLLTLALHLPLIRAGTDYSDAFWSPPQWLNIPKFYEDVLAPAIVPAAALLVIAVVWTAMSRADEEGSPAQVTPCPLHEMVAACGFVLLPFVAVVLAKLSTGAFVNRYVLPAVIGVAVLVGMGVATAFRRHPVLRLMAALCLGGWFVLSQLRELREPTGNSQPFSQRSVDRPSQWLQELPGPTLPLVVADPHTFTTLSHYGSLDVRSRMVYTADPGLALKHLGHNSVERGMLDLVGPWFGMNVVEFEPFVRQHPRFLVYGDFVRLEFLNWLGPELRERGFHTELVNRASDNLLLLVTTSDAGAGQDGSHALEPSGS